jgi:hypothetical protein
MAQLSQALADLDRYLLLTLIVGPLVGAILVLVLASSAALLLRAEFQFTDGVLFGVVGGALGALAALFVAPLLIDRMESGLPSHAYLPVGAGVIIGMVVGSLAGWVATWRTVSRQRRVRQIGRPAV